MKKIWMNGCFDVLHYGHFKMIEFGSTFNGLLTIGIDSDKRVKELKGNNRPFHSQEERKYNLERIKGIEKVIIFNTEKELKETIKLYKPDIFIIGSDYKNKPIIGEHYAKSIIYFDRIKNFSTTKILNKS